MTARIGPLVAAAFLLAACSASSGKPGADGRLAQGVTPLHYDLALTVDPREERFSGVAKIRVKLDSSTRRFWLHSREATVETVSLDAGGRTIAATWADGGEGFAEVRLASAAPAGEATLTVNYDAPFNDSAAGLYHSESGGEKYAVTQFEALDARRAFPSFDQPSFKTPFAVSIVARAGDTVIANTTETGAEPAGEGLVRHTFRETLPIPTYLVAFAVGPYDVVQGPLLPKTAQREAVQLRGVAVKGKGAQTRYALSITADLIAYFEEYFATPYPYDKLDFIAAPEFSAGAMENVGAIVYAEQAILMGPDAPVAQQRGIVTTHAHEIAHQWFGNLVTPAWWDDIWLNEAFATWMSYKAANAVFPDGGYEREIQLRAIAAMEEDSLSSARRIREPIVTESDIEDAFDAITYSKGGGVLAMAESYLGDDAFREGVRTHMRRFPHGVATSRDFFESLGQGSKRPGGGGGAGFVHRPQPCAADRSAHRVPHGRWRPARATGAKRVGAGRRAAGTAAMDRAGVPHLVRAHRPRREILHDALCAGRRRPAARRLPGVRIAERCGRRLLSLCPRRARLDVAHRRLPPARSGRTDRYARQPLRGLCREQGKRRAVAARSRSRRGRGRPLGAPASHDARGQGRRRTGQRGRA